jgi:predicted TPR repeat methyltransferase
MTQEQGAASGSTAPTEAKVSIEEALQVAVTMHQRGRLGEAQAIYQQVLDVAPDHPDALHYLGVVCHHCGQGDQGVELIRRAIDRVPDHPDMRNNLANVLMELGRNEEAEATYRALIELAPEHADAHSNLGIVLKAQERCAEAEAMLRRAIELCVEHADAWHNLGNVLHKLERDDEAVPAYHKAIELRPFDARSYTQLGALYRAIGRPDQAGAVYRRWLENDPDSPVAAHMLAAVGEGEMPGRASDGFVKSIFEPFAATFDSVLRGLHYRAPELVRDLVATVLGEPAGDLTVLDAGCGTGLVGPLVGPYARRLTGVDLSPAMVTKASGRRVYDELIVAELTAYLDGCDADYDLVVASDTLCYFGDLEPVIRNARRALAPGGHLAFTTEDAKDLPADVGFRLEHHGRYAHREDYLRATVGAAGLELLSIDSDVLRTEHGTPVPGLLVLARRPD